MNEIRKRPLFKGARPRGHRPKAKKIAYLWVWPIFSVTLIEPVSILSRKTYLLGERLKKTFVC